VSARGAFPLSLVTDEIDQDLGRALDVARELGVRQVELRTLWGKNVIALDDDEVERARRLLRARGMAVGLVGTSIFKCFLWDDRRRPVRDAYFPQELSFDEHAALVEPALRLAERLGAPCIRIFS
jgi:sugar phosphate isomerase/epimerase